MTQTRLWLVRHGESKWNAQRRIQGQSGEGLSDVGHVQARAVARWLSQRLGSAAVVSSDLRRARETAAPIATALECDVQVDTALRERAFGRWEGKRFEDLDEADRVLWEEWVSGERDVIGDEVGGESARDLSARVVEAFVAHAQQAVAVGRAHTVLVTHGGVLWQGLHGLFEMAPPVFAGFGNTSISTVLVADEVPWLEMSNATPHLDPTDARQGFRLQGDESP